jgi:uncharacterized protein YaiL (DUF2058 family)
MGKSLQDQLLGVGLTNKKQVAKAKKAQSKHNKQKQQNRKKGESLESDGERQTREAQTLKAAADKELNRLRDQKSNKKAVSAQIKQIIEHSRQERFEHSELRFNFTDGTTVKYLQVSETQQRHLANGFLAIVKSADQQYALIPSKAADKIAQRDPAVVVLWNKKDSKTDDKTSLEEDPYADFEIPDDLMW